VVLDHTAADYAGFANGQASPRLAKGLLRRSESWNEEGFAIFGPRDSIFEARDTKPGTG